MMLGACTALVLGTLALLVLTVLVGALIPPIETDDVLETFESWDSLLTIGRGLGALAVTPWRSIEDRFGRGVIWGAPRDRTGLIVTRRGAALALSPEVTLADALLDDELVAAVPVDASDRRRACDLAGLGGGGPAWV